MSDAKTIEQEKSEAKIHMLWIAREQFKHAKLEFSRNTRGFLKGEACLAVATAVTYVFDRTFGGDGYQLPLMLFALGALAFGVQLTVDGLAVRNTRKEVAAASKVDLRSGLTL